MRMIDADALRESIITRQTEMSYEDAWALTCVDNAPTIEPQKWILFHKRELTEEEQEMYPEWSYWLDCELPEDGDEILISSPTWGVYKDTFNNDGSDGCYLEGCEEIDDGMAWMPLPEPWGGDSDE